MTPDSSYSLLTRLLLKNQDATEEEHRVFFEQLFRHRFSRLLHLYDKNQETESVKRVPVSPPAENQISFLLQCGHSHLFLQNILYHLERNQKVIPPALLPGILDWLSKYPNLWTNIYGQHPDLLLALSQSRKEWGYLYRSFQHDLTLLPGSPGYYEALEGRMQFLPLKTSRYIRVIYPVANPHQQARLIDILGQDASPETALFIASQISHARKPVRLAALRICLQHKISVVYDPVKAALLQYQPGSDPDKGLPSSDDLPASWKDLASIAEQVSGIDILTALTDPDDYRESHQDLYEHLNKSAITRASIFHRSQRALYQMGKEHPPRLVSLEFIEALDSGTAIKLLHALTSDPNSTFDQAYINLLERVRLFLGEEDSDRVWQKFVKQWSLLPFTLEDMDLEILALRIHPNKLNSIWQDPVLQESAEVLQKIRKILKNRLDFLKKCYG